MLCIIIKFGKNLFRKSLLPHSIISCTFLEKGKYVISSLEEDLGTHKALPPVFILRNVKMENISFKAKYSPKMNGIHKRVLMQPH